jgi:hypothetical protein
VPAAQIEMVATFRAPPQTTLRSRLHSSTEWTRGPPKRSVWLCEIGLGIQLLFSAFQTTHTRIDPTLDALLMHDSSYEQRVAEGGPDGRESNASC